MMGSFLVALNAISLLIGIHLLKRSLKNVAIYSRILQEAENLEDDTIKELANAKIPEGITMDDVHKYVRKEADMVARIKEIYQSVDSYREAVAQQIAQSSSIEPADFKARLQEGIGGHSE